MAKHLNEYHCMGRVADNITLQEKDGKVYCYFRLGIGQGTRTNAEGKVEDIPTLWLDFRARGPVATYLSKFTRKGDLLFVRGELTLTQNVREVNGVKTVYNDVTINVDKVFKCASASSSTSKNDETENGEDSRHTPAEPSGAGIQASVPVEVPPLSEEEAMAVEALPI